MRRYWHYCSSNDGIVGWWKEIWWQ